MNSPERRTYNLHGLHVRSEVPLSAPVARTGRVDLDFRWGHRPLAPDEPLIGRPMARLTFNDGRGYCLTRSDAGWRLRFDGVAEFRFDAALRHARVHLAPEGNRAVVPLLIAGSVAAFVLSLASKCILHASAIEVDGDGIGFLGGSGMGKSTLAALCCANGARLVADDILRLEPTRTGFRCVRGPAQVRLREGSATLAEHFEPKASCATADKRLALRVRRAATDRVQLRLLVVPHASRHCREIRFERLRNVEALHALVSHSRVVGWMAPELVSRQFDRFAGVAAHVPVYNALVPWGPPFSPALFAALTSHLQTLVHTAG